MGQFAHHCRNLSQSGVSGDPLVLEKMQKEDLGLLLASVLTAEHAQFSGIVAIHELVAQAAE